MRVAKLKKIFRGTFTRIPAGDLVHVEAIEGDQALLKWNKEHDLNRGGSIFFLPLDELYDLEEVFVDGEQIPLFYAEDREGAYSYRY